MSLDGLLNLVRDVQWSDNNGGVLVRWRVMDLGYLAFCLSFYSLRYFVIGTLLGGWLVSTCSSRVTL